MAEKTATNPKGAGAPLKDIDPKRVVRLAAKGLYTTEIARILHCSVDVLQRRFKDELERGASLCNASLRSRQVKEALRGNITMLIWLGKQRLGQKDETSHNENVRIIVQPDGAVGLQAVSETTGVSSLPC